MNYKMVETYVEEKPDVSNVFSLCFIGGLCFATGMKIIDILFKVEQ